MFRKHWFTGAALVAALLFTANSANTALARGPGGGHVGGAHFGGASHFGGVSHFGGGHVGIGTHFNTGHVGMGGIGSHAAFSHGFATYQPSFHTVNPGFRTSGPATIGRVRPSIGTHQYVSPGGFEHAIRPGLEEHRLPGGITTVRHFNPAIGEFHEGHGTIGQHYEGHGEIGEHREHEFGEHGGFGYYSRPYYYYNFGYPYVYFNYPYYTYPNYTYPYYTYPYYSYPYSGYGYYEYGYPETEYVYPGTTYEYGYPATTTYTAPAAMSTISVEGATYLGEAQDAFRRGDYQEALRLATHAAVEMPKDATVHQLMSLAMLALNNYHGAAAEAHAALSLGPAPTWSDTYPLYANPQDYTSQLRNLEKYVQGHSDQPEGHFLLGYEYLMLGHRDAAREQFSTAASQAPKDELARQMVEQLGGTVSAPAATPAATPSAV